MKKLTIEEVDKRLINNNYIPLFSKYKNRKQSLEVLNLDGYKVLISIDELANNSIPTIVSETNPYSIENINKWLMNNDKDFILKSDVFNNTKSYLKWYCLKHKHEWLAPWGRIKNNVGCPICGIEKAAQSKTLNLEYIKDELLKINKNIEILDSNYFDSQSKLKCKCLIKDCNNEWYSNWSGLKQLRGCPKCAIRKRIKSFNIKLIEKNKIKLVSSKAILYIIKCFNDIEEFYKIGITTKNLKIRFNNKKLMPYNFSIVKELNLNLYDALYLEEKLHKQHNIHVYSPKIKFKGHTECFSQIINNI